MIIEGKKNFVLKDIKRNKKNKTCSSSAVYLAVFIYTRSYLKKLNRKKLIEPNGI